MKAASIKQKLAGRVILIGMITFSILLAVSVFVIVPTLRESAIKTTKQANEEVIQQINTLVTYIGDYTENLIPSVNNNNKILKYFEEPTEQNRSIAALNLNNLISNVGLARSVFITSDKAVSLDSLNKISDADYKILDSDWYKRLYASEFGRGFSAAYKINLPTTYYTAAYSKNFYHKNQKFNYTVFFGLNNLIYSTDLTTGNVMDYYALVDAESNVFYSKGDEKWASIARDKAQSKVYNGIEDVDGGICFINTSTDSKWKVVSFASYDTIYRPFTGYILAIIFGMLLLLGLLLLSIFQAMTQMLKPISYMSQNMEQVAKGNLDCQLDVLSEDEIGRLSQSFNSMIINLKHSLGVIEEKEKRENQAKFSLLVSQINPHFIYNTLNSINYLARRGDCDAIVTVNTALINILQDRLRVNDIQITDTIANEIRVINQYILIQRYMYEGELQIHWHVEEALMTEQIPKNLIQPLVENSLFHGLISEESGDIQGEINIYIEKHEDNIVIRVADNGIGMDIEKLEQVQKEAYAPEERGKRIGLSNVRGRLYYLYGGYDCLTIHSEPGKGTCITLTLKQDRMKI